MSNLTFDQLRAANIVRLPQFKNKHGENAHRESDGSDWDFATWFMAIIGEMGELAQLRSAYEGNTIPKEMYENEVGKEIADVVTYMDILSLRALDSIPEVAQVRQDRAQDRLLSLIAFLGIYANAQKKFNRGDISKEDFFKIRNDTLQSALVLLKLLMKAELFHTTKQGTSHPRGVDMGQAVVDKFNEVSDRVGCKVKL